jgi:hypothetical protein
MRFAMRLRPPPVLLLSLAALAALAPAPLAAQAPVVPMPGDPLPIPLPPPPPPTPREPAWFGSIGLGFAVTSGNADTSTLNVSVEPSTRALARNVFRADGRFLRGERNGELNLNLNQLSMRMRDEYTRPPAATIGKNDVSVVTALVYKF